MVVDTDLEGAARLGDAFGRLDVAAAGLGVAGGMIVHQDEPGGTDLECAADDFARIDRGVVDRPVRHGLSEQAVLRIEEEHPEALERRMRHVRAQIIDQLLTGGKDRPAEGFMLEAAQHDVTHGGEQFDGSMISDRPGLCGWSGTEDGRNRAELLDQPIGPVGGLVRPAAAKKAFQELSAP